MSDSIVVENFILGIRKVLEWIGNIAGPFALFLFGIVIMLTDNSENIFTFAAWGALDFLTGVCMLYAGAKKESVLPIGYGVICLFVVAMIFNNGIWQWTIVETICLIGVVVGLIGSFVLGPVFGVIAMSTAAGIASIPLLKDNFFHPQTWEWFLWVGSFISATIGLYLSYPWHKGNIQDWMFVAVSEAITIGILILILRPLFW
jgi:hypothetical protein